VSSLIYKDQGAAARRNPGVKLRARRVSEGEEEPAGSVDRPSGDRFASATISLCSMRYAGQVPSALASAETKTSRSGPRSRFGWRSEGVSGRARGAPAAVLTHPLAGGAP